MSSYIMGFDIGGTKCAVILASIQNGIAIRERVCFPTDAKRGSDQVIAQLFSAGHALLKRNHVDAHALLAVGVSCGGPLDSHRGIVLSPPHLPGWDEVPITDMIEREFGVKAFLQNDANACALVEWQLGAGRGSRNMVFLTMGTGFGAGIIAEGKLIEGASGLAGEIGHVRLTEDGGLCYGKSGTVEAYVCGAGIAQAAIDYTRDAIDAPAWTKDGHADDALSVKLLSEYAKKGDKDALALFERTGEMLGRTLAILMDMLNPECIVIGSIFVRCEPYLRDAMQRTLEEEALPDALKDCKVLPAETGEKLGDYASIMAACYALNLPVEKQSIENEAIKAHMGRMLIRYPDLEGCAADFEEAYSILRDAFAADGKLMVLGNGGSAADAGHIVGELMKGFLLKRPLPEVLRAQLGDTGTKLQRSLPAIDLTQHNALNTAFQNDVDPALCFAQQVLGYGRRGDVLLCLSTSGNAKNACEAAKVARTIGMRVIALTGAGGGALKALSDVCVRVPATETPDIQELHLPVYHTLCAMLEEAFFGE